MSFVLSTGNEILAIPYIGNMTFVSSMFDSHRFTRCSLFLFFNPLVYLPMHISSGLFFWLAILAFMFPVIPVIYWY